MNIHYLPFIASFIFLVASLFAFYRPGRIQGVLYSLVGFCASAWIFSIGYEYLLYSVNSRDLVSIKISSFLVGVFSHVFVPIVILLAWKFPPVQRIHFPTLSVLLIISSFMAVISWWGIEMKLDGLAIVRKQNKTIMTIQGMWFLVGTGYGLFLLHKKRLTMATSRVREAQIRSITLSLTLAFVFGVVLTHFFSIFFSGKQILHINVIVISGFFTSIAYLLPLLFELFGQKLYFQKYDPDVVKLVEILKTVPDKDLAQKITELRKEGYDLSIIDTIKLPKNEQIIYWEDYDYKPDSDEYKFLSKYDSEAIILKEKNCICIHNGMKTKQEITKFLKGDFGIYKDAYFQFINDLVSGRVLTNYSNFEWSNFYLCSGYAKLYKVFTENKSPIKIQNREIPSFHEYCQKNNLSLHENYGLFKVESRLKILTALSFYLRDNLHRN